MLGCSCQEQDRLCSVCCFEANCTNCMIYIPESPANRGLHANACSGDWSGKFSLVQCERLFFEMKIRLLILEFIKNKFYFYID